jgi:hypothetical protein
MKFPIVAALVSQSLAYAQDPLSEMAKRAPTNDCELFKKEIAPALKFSYAGNCSDEVIASENGRIVKINLFRKDAPGIIPPQLGRLSELKSL